jgi:hypothetical protein
MPKRKPVSGEWAYPERAQDPAAAKSPAAARPASAEQSDSTAGHRQEGPPDKAWQWVPSQDDTLSLGTSGEGLAVGDDVRTEADIDGLAFEFGPLSFGLSKVEVDAAASADGGTAFADTDAGFGAGGADFVLVSDHTRTWSAGEPISAYQEENRELWALAIDIQGWDSVDGQAVRYSSLHEAFHGLCPPQDALMEGSLAQAEADGSAFASRSFVDTNTSTFTSDGFGVSSADLLFAIA